MFHGLEMNPLLFSIVGNLLIGAFIYAYVRYVGNHYVRVLPPLILAVSILVATGMITLVHTLILLEHLGLALGLLALMYTLLGNIKYYYVRVLPPLILAILIVFVTVLPPMVGLWRSYMQNSALHTGLLWGTLLWSIAFASGWLALNKRAEMKNQVPTPSAEWPRGKLFASFLLLLVITLGTHYATELKCTPLYVPYTAWGCGMK